MTRTMELLLPVPKGTKRNLKICAVSWVNLHNLETDKVFMFSSGHILETPTENNKQAEGVYARFKMIFCGVRKNVKRRESYSKLHELPRNPAFGGEGVWGWSGPQTG